MIFRLYLKVQFFQVFCSRFSIKMLDAYLGHYQTSMMKLFSRKLQRLLVTKLDTWIYDQRYLISVLDEALGTLA